MEDDDLGTTETTGDDFPDFSTFSLTEETSTETPVEQSNSSATEDEGDNPKWAPILGIVPEMFHSQLKPLLKEQDRGVNARFQELAAERQQYEAYKPLIEAQIPPGEIQKALQVIDNLNQDPVGMMERLRDSLVQRGLYQEAQQVQDEIEEKSDDDDDVSDPRLKARMDQFEQQQQAFFANLEVERQNQIQQVNVQKARASLDQQLSELNSRYNLSEDAQKEVLLRAHQMNQMYGRDIPLQEAFDEFQKVLSAASRTPRRAAPRVMPTGGGLPGPTQQKRVSEMSQDERFAAAGSIIDRMFDQD